MNFENKNPQSIDITDGSVEYRQAVDALNQAVTAKIFEQGLESKDEPGLPTLIETNNNRIFAISGKTDERGPETTIDDITDKKRIRYVISPEGLVWLSGGIEGDDRSEKLSAAGVTNLANVIANAQPAPEEFTTVYHAVEAERARGVLPMGVLKAEAMEPVPGGTLTAERSIEISKRNNRGFLAKFGNAITQAFVGKSK